MSICIARVEYVNEWYTDHTDHWDIKERWYKKHLPNKLLTTTRWK